LGRFDASFSTSTAPHVTSNFTTDSTTDCNSADLVPTASIDLTVFFSPKRTPPPAPRPNGWSNFPLAAAEVNRQMSNYEHAWDPASRRIQYKRLSANVRNNFFDSIKHAEYASLPTTTASFKHFTKLPPEIRARIWRYAIPGPRIIELE
jgi:hypothetical protein